MSEQIETQTHTTIQKHEPTGSRWDNECQLCGCFITNGEIAERTKIDDEVTWVCDECADIQPDQIDWKDGGTKL